MCFFIYICTLFSGAHGSFLALLAKGHAGGPPAHHSAVWVQGGLRGVCSGCSKSRNLASNHEVVFRGARAEQDNGKTHASCFAPLL